MCKLTGGPGFPLIPGGPGKPRAPWKKKAIKYTWKCIVMLEAIDCYTLSPETGFEIILWDEKCLLTCKSHKKSSHRTCYFSDFWCTSQIGKKILIYLSFTTWRSMPDHVLLLTTVSRWAADEPQSSRGKYLLREFLSRFHIISLILFLFDASLNNTWQPEFCPCPLFVFFHYFP